MSLWCCRTFAGSSWRLTLSLFLSLFLFVSFSLSFSLSLSLSLSLCLFLSLFLSLSLSLSPSPAADALPPTPLRRRKVLTAYAKSKGVDVTKFKFLLDGQRLSLAEDGDKPVKMLEIEDGDQIDAMVEQQGGF